MFVPGGVNWVAALPILAFGFALALVSDEYRKANHQWSARALAVISLCVSTAALVVGVRG